MGLDQVPAAALRRRTISGSVWSVAASWGYQLVSVAVALVLTRLLDPAAFGLVGMVTVLTGFAGLLGDPGLSAALVQRRDVTEGHYRSVFWTSAALGAVLSLAFVAAAPWLARFYRTPQLAALTVALAPTFMLASLAQVQVAIMQKRMEFRTLAGVDLGALLLSGTVAIGLALAGFHVWSLVAQALVLAATRSGLLWVMCDWRPGLGFEWPRLRELLAFGGGTLGFSTGNYCVRNADNFLIGKLMGKESLGLYSRAYSIMLLPITMLSGRIGAVLFAAFSSIQTDRARVAAAYLRSIAIVALVTFPMMTGLLLTARPLVEAVLGAQWLPMVPLLQVFCAVGLIESIGTLNGSLYLSQGRTGLRLKVLAVIGPLAVLAIAIGTRWGILGVARGYAVYSALVTVPTMAIPLSLVGLRLRDAGRSLAGAAAAALLMGIAVLAAGRVLPAELPAPARLATLVGAGVASYLGAVAALRLRAASDLVALLREQWGAGRDG